MYSMAASVIALVTMTCSNSIGDRSAKRARFTWHCAVSQFDNSLTLASCGDAASCWLFCVFLPEDQTCPIVPGAAEDDDFRRPAVQVVQQERAGAENA